MRKVPGSLFVAIVISLFISSCYDNPVVNDSNEIRPLAIGNYWIYSIDTSSHFYPMFYCDTMRVVSYENLNGYNAYGIDFNKSYILYFNNKNDGQYYYQKTLHDSTFEYIPQLFIKYPVKINDTIVVNGKCVSLNSTFNNYSGCIDIIPFDTTFGGMRNYHEYWKPGIGFIGAQFDFSGKHYMNRLTAYHIQ